MVVALIITELFLLGFIRTMPYNDFRTNVLAILSQSVMVISYFSTIMLKLDEETRGTWITEAGISYIMIAVNVPMGFYFAYDITMDVRERLELIDNLLEEEQSEQAGNMSLRDMRKSMRSKSQDNLSKSQDYNSSDALQPKKGCDLLCPLANLSARLTPGACVAARSVKMVNPMLTADD